VKIIEVDPEDMPSMSDVRRRGRVSYPIIKMFMESNLYSGKVDTSGMPQKPKSIYNN